MSAVQKAALSLFVLNIGLACSSSWGEFWLTQNLSLNGGLPPYIVSNNVMSGISNYPYKLPISGGQEPYSVTIAGSSLNATYGLTPQILDGDILSLGAINLASYPSAVNASTAGLMEMGALRLRITDASGKSTENSFMLQLQFKRVFVMSTPLSPTTLAPLSSTCVGLATAVAKVNCTCQVLAASASPPLPNAKKFRGWISTSGTLVHARCNVAGQPDNCASVPVNAGGPWYTTAGNLVARDMSTVLGTGLLGGTLLSQINRTESNISQAVGQPGNYAGYSSVWSGTTAAGAAESTCGDWTGANPGTIADQTSTTSSWSSATAGGTCGVSFPFYCIEGDL